jgi:hypothetical protein
MVLTTGVTATAGMLPVLSDTTMTVGNVTAQLPGLLLARGHPAQAFLQSETTHYLSSIFSTLSIHIVQHKYWNQL